MERLLAFVRPLDQLWIITATLLHEHQWDLEYIKCDYTALRMIINCKVCHLVLCLDSNSANKDLRSAPVCPQLVSMTSFQLLCLWDPLWGLRSARKRWNPPVKPGQKCICQQIGQPGEETFKLRKIGERNDDPQSHREVVDWLGKQKMQGGVDKTS